MSAEENKAIVRRAIEEVWNKENLAIVDEIYAANYIVHDPNAPWLEDIHQLLSIYRSAFPDLHMVIDDLIAEGNKVMERWTMTGTHRGTVVHIPPTGERVEVTGISIFRFEGGKMKEEWSSWNALGLMQQLGLVAPLG
ncbi:MAG: ester cyclase [Ardenticatenaceae bacterium]|nr:ester cyclase [Ardenticatenaceae bacterium]HBY97013.1 ester cyclase [Chloroflexota bacterium]